VPAVLCGHEWDGLLLPLRGASLGGEAGQVSGEEGSRVSEPFRPLPFHELMKRQAAYDRIAQELLNGDTPTTAWRQSGSALAMHEAIMARLPGELMRHE
jgi:hypothetical protein